MENTKKESDPLVAPEKSTNTTFAVICFIALAQGVLGLADLGMSYLYKDEFRMSPA